MTIIWVYLSIWVYINLFVQIWIYLSIFEFMSKMSLCIYEYIWVYLILWVWVYLWVFLFFFYHVWVYMSLSIVDYISLCDSFLTVGVSVFFRACRARSCPSTAVREWRVCGGGWMGPCRGSRWGQRLNWPRSARLKTGSHAHRSAHTHLHMYIIQLLINTETFALKKTCP